MSSKPSDRRPDATPHFESGRRTFLKQASGLFGAVVAGPSILAQTDEPRQQGPTDADQIAGKVEIKLKVNGSERQLTVEPRTTLLDTLRDHLALPGTKKGCDHGTCGACTVHIEGERVLSCLTLSVMTQGKAVTTIEGLSTGDELHPVQQAFVDCDGFQCGFCTPGQIMSSVACLREGHTRSEEEIKEWMSGNLCRCAAYPNIVDAVKKAAAQKI